MLLPKEVKNFSLLMNLKKSPFLFHMSKDISVKHICNSEALELTIVPSRIGICIYSPTPGIFPVVSALSLLVLCQTALDQLALDTSGCHSGK